MAALDDVRINPGKRQLRGYAVLLGASSRSAVRDVIDEAFGPFINERPLTAQTGRDAASDHLSIP